MKKFLLILTLASVVCGSALAANKEKDPNTYPEVNGINVKNLWLRDRVHYGAADLELLDWCNSSARTGALLDGVIYIGRSEAKTVVPTPGDTILQSVIYRIDATTGESLPPLDVTLNGQPYGAFRGVNNVGKDNFGHVWVAPLSLEANPQIPFYQLNTETGELTLLTTFDKGDVVNRIDYLDVVGDITLEEAECNVMTPSLQATVYGWHNDQGGDGDTWEGYFSGDPYQDFTEFYPENQTAFSFGPVSRFVLGEDEDTRYSGENFYIDGFNTVPVLYANDGSVIDGFGSLTQDELDADSLLMPAVGTNGIAEFTLGDRNFIVYSIAQYDGANSCQINVCELGEGMAFSGMQRYWTIPADGLGQVSDGGNRVHILQAEYVEEGGKPAIRLFNFKCYNGIGVYLIGEGVTPDGPQGEPADVNGDGNVTAADVAAVYNYILDGDETFKASSDVNGDGSVTAGDITSIYNIMLGN